MEYTKLSNKFTNDPSNKIRFTTSFLELVKQYLITNMHQQPSISYDSFIVAHHLEINEEKIKNNKIEETMFFEKLKKMYKNQYYTNIKSCIL